MIIITALVVFPFDFEILEAGFLSYGMPLVLKDLEAGFLYASYVRTGLPFDFETLEADSMHVHIAF